MLPFGIYYKLPQGLATILAEYAWFIKLLQTVAYTVELQWLEQLWDHEN